MHILTVLVAVIGILIFPALRGSKASEEDDCVGLFVGSARPLPAAPAAARSRNVAGRPQKRSQLV